MQHSGKSGSADGGSAYRKLATTLETVFSEAVYDHAALQKDVCSYVDELKESGASAQKVINAARKLVRETASRFPPSERTENLLKTMLGWCLDEYYRESA
jgi:1,2-phenylacetyl-CoA epoxidase catalytic subunit